MATKIFRDPLYNYVSIELSRDKWLLDLLDCPEVQRLRRIHQLGISNLTYPGADHNRLAHSLGVLHLMQLALGHLKSICDDEQVNRGRAPLLAAALIHDVGHGPFSHLFEPCLGIDHEVWSRKIILSEDTKVHKVLKTVDTSLPRIVADLIDKDNHDHPSWQKYLLSSQLDVDRLDYLRRDSLFSGAGYGHFDWHRILTTFEIHDDGASGRDMIWAEKSVLAIEEYIFARYYMYQNVYLHKTTRGFEKMLEALWRRGRQLHSEGVNVDLVPKLAAFLPSPSPTVDDYLVIEEFTVLQQLQNWTQVNDQTLADLSRRFLARQRFAMIEPPQLADSLSPNLDEWESALHKLVSSKAEYQPVEMYCLKDPVKAKYNQPYFPEKEADEQSVKNAIRIRIGGESSPVEISNLLPRLRLLTQEPTDRIRYYVPKDLQAQANALRSGWPGSHPTRGKS